VRHRIDRGTLLPDSPFDLSHAIVGALTRREIDLVATLAQESGRLEQRGARGWTPARSPNGRYRPMAVNAKPSRSSRLNHSGTAARSSPTLANAGPRLSRANMVSLTSTPPHARLNQTCLDPPPVTGIRELVIVSNTYA